MGVQRRPQHHVLCFSQRACYCPFQTRVIRHMHLEVGGKYTSMNIGDTNTTHNASRGATCLCGTFKLDGVRASRVAEAAQRV